MRVTLGHVKFVTILFIGLCFICLSSSGFASDKKPSPCDGRQWKDPSEELDCRFPYPPIGRWKAVYTADFAKTHNLPPENISTDLSPGVDYMEMDVQPYNKGLGTACLVNMLIKRPNDVAYYNSSGDEFVWGKSLNANRKLAHLLNIDAHNKKLVEISTFGLSARQEPYSRAISYSIGGAFAFYAENVVNGHDFVTANVECRSILIQKNAFPNHWAFTYAKASIWGKYQSKYLSMADEKFPKDDDFYNSRSYINIPEEIILSIFENMPVGGQ
jgi:hypothetical protein